MIAWQDLSTILQPKELNGFKLIHYKLDEERLKWARVRDLMNRSYETRGQKPGVIVQLIGPNGNLMMSDAEMEKDTNREFIWSANGDVLIGGLGLGMILLQIQNKHEVDNVTVVELHQEVIDLVAAQLPLHNKVNIIQADIRDWYPVKGVLYDTIYFDIWDAVCGDSWREMSRLHRRFCKRLNRENPWCWMSSWRKFDFQRAARGRSL